MSENDLNNTTEISDPSTWVDNHGDVLYRYAIVRTNDSSVAEDIIQETFLAALKARNNFAGKSSERTWLIGILKNKIVDHIRKTSKECNFEDIDTAFTDGETAFVKNGPMAGSWTPKSRPVDWNIDKSDIVEQKEFWEFLQYCLSELPPKAAMIFILKEMEEIKSEKICNDLKINATNLRVIIYRARSQLRKCLEKNWIGIEK